jgi:hypothetical protein
MHSTTEVQGLSFVVQNPIMCAAVPTSFGAES